MPAANTYKDIRRALAAVAPAIRFNVKFGNPENRNYLNTERTVEISYNALALAELGIRQAQLRTAVNEVLNRPHWDHPNLSRISFYPYQPEPIRVSEEKLASLLTALRAPAEDPTSTAATETNTAQVLIKLLPHVDKKTAALLQAAAVELDQQVPQQTPKPLVPVELGGALPDLPEYEAPICPICGDHTDDGAHPDEGYCERADVHYNPETGRPLRDTQTP